MFVNWPVHCVVSGGFEYFGFVEFSWWKDDDGDHRFHVTVRHFQFPEIVAACIKDELIERIELVGFVSKDGVDKTDAPTFLNAVVPMEAPGIAADAVRASRERELEEAEIVDDARRAVLGMTDRPMREVRP
ncbi:hypothetical protein [Rhodovulum strictum]|uniref:Uncharacterized protein n=1 Tax=Rhodovulum strictum TaxID=58314 RepID=A0A844BLV4_9RHOB|nr:hypothetical protein [Rhodovulum strictum]MRH22675.1 hypothetical protein [Rhodovulum strictum]